MIVVAQSLGRHLIDMTSALRRRLGKIGQPRICRRMMRIRSRRRVRLAANRIPDRWADPQGGNREHRCEHDERDRRREQRSEPSLELNEQGHGENETDRAEENAPSGPG